MTIQCHYLKKESFFQPGEKDTFGVLSVNAGKFGRLSFKLSK